MREDRYMHFDGVLSRVRRPRLHLCLSHLVAVMSPPARTHAGTRRLGAAKARSTRDKESEDNALDSRECDAFSRLVLRLFCSSRSCTRLMLLCCACRACPPSCPMRPCASAESVPTDSSGHSRHARLTVDVSANPAPTRRQAHRMGHTRTK